jgi:4-amino-4-deoxy-L-arabinose transferase-like glycosyltransferase
VLVLLFFLSLTVVTVWGTWQEPLPDSNDAVLAETGREVLTTHDLTVMHFDGAPVHDTPPLVPWMLSAFYAVFGVNNFSARLPFVILSVLSVYLIYLAGRLASRDHDRDESRPSIFGSLPTGLGLLSAIILASSPFFSRFSPHITTGLPFAFFSSMALVGWLSTGWGGEALWGVGVGGGVLAFGAGGYLLIVGAALASAVDRERRAVWRRPGFVAATIVGAVAGALWLFPETARGGVSVWRSPLWAPLVGVLHPSARSISSVLAVCSDSLLRNLPWSIPAVFASARIVFARGERRHNEWVARVDWALFIFAAALFFPTAFGGSREPSLYLAALPFGAVLSSREIVRWIARSSRRVTRPIWTFNHIMTAVFCLLMLLLVATPLHLRRVGPDPIQDVARMAGRLVPAGERVGNYRQRYRVQCARMLFYGDRSLEEPRTDPSAVAAAIEKNPGRIFLSSLEDVDSLRRAGDFPFNLRVLYGSGDLVLFAAEQHPAAGSR